MMINVKAKTMRLTIPTARERKYNAILWTSHNSSQTPTVYLAAHNTLTTRNTQHALCFSFTMAATQLFQQICVFYGIMHFMKHVQPWQKNNLLPNSRIMQINLMHSTLPKIERILKSLFISIWTYWSVYLSGLKVYPQH